MLTRWPVAALAAVGLVGVGAGLWAAPVLAKDPPPCTSQAGCNTSPVTVSAFDSILGLPPHAGKGSGGGGWTGGGGGVCTGPLAVGEALTVGPTGQLVWIGPNGQRHTGGQLELPISEYYGVADYSRAGTVQTVPVVPATTPPSTKQVCVYSAWQANGFAFYAVHFGSAWTVAKPAVPGLEALVTKDLIGGSIMTAPPKMALVGLATNAWVVGSNIPALVIKSKTVTTGPIASAGGRSLVLTVAVAIQRLGVEYRWGDKQTEFIPSGTGTAMGAPPTPDYSNNTVMSNSAHHTYYIVSYFGEHPSPFPVVTKAGFIPISAVQELQVSAVAIWQDASGRHERSLGSYALNINVAPRWVMIGQVEGIPVCPSPTNCS